MYSYIVNIATFPLSLEIPKMSMKAHELKTINANLKPVEVTINTSTSPNPPTTPSSRSSITTD